MLVGWEREQVRFTSYYPRRCPNTYDHVVAVFCMFFCQAVKMDVTEGGDDEAVTSSMVDDVFFIVQKAVRWVMYIKLEM